jgi:hypothetical protein
MVASTPARTRQRPGRQSAFGPGGAGQRWWVARDGPDLRSPSTLPSTRRGTNARTGLSSNSAARLRTRSLMAPPTSGRRPPTRSTTLARARCSSSGVMATLSIGPAGCSIPCGLTDIQSQSTYVTRPGHIRPSGPPRACLAAFRSDEELPASPYVDNALGNRVSKSRMPTHSGFTAMRPIGRPRRPATHSRPASCPMYRSHASA